jgi:hypothetical protein
MVLVIDCSDFQDFATGFLGSIETLPLCDSSEYSQV